MSGNFCATNLDLYAVVDLAKKKSGNQVSSKNKKSDIPIYNVLEQREDKSHKERENSLQQLSNDPQDLYSKLDYRKISQKSITPKNQPTSPLQIPMRILNQSGRSDTAFEEDKERRKV